MSNTSIFFAGLSRDEEAGITSLFKQANARRGNRWHVAPESDAAVLVIDMDSMYGQMSLMKALGSGKTLVALTAGGRVDTDHVLTRPVTAEAMEALLAALEAGAPAPDASAKVTAEIPVAAPPAPTPVPAPEPAPTPVVATPAIDPAASRITAEQPVVPAAVEPAPVAAAPVVPIPVEKRADPRLADHLRPGAHTGPVRVQAGDAPAIVLDPATQTWFGGATLKPLLPYGTAIVRDEDFSPVPASEVQALAAQAGAAQPYSRLAWLCALGGGNGALAAGYNPNDRYKLLKWPQTEREFPKHFRIATVMMKGPATLSEIAELSGVALAEVIDYVNASLAVGVAEPDSPAPAPAPDAKGGGLLGRFRR